MDHLRLLPIRATVLLPSYDPGPQLGVGLALLGDRLGPGRAAPLLNVLGSGSEACRGSGPCAGLHGATRTMARHGTSRQVCQDPSIGLCQASCHIVVCALGLNL